MNFLIEYSLLRLGSYKLKIQCYILISRNKTQQCFVRLVEKRKEKIGWPRTTGNKVICHPGKRITNAAAVCLTDEILHPNKTFYASGIKKRC